MAHTLEVVIGFNVILFALCLASLDAAKKKKAKPWIAYIIGVVLYVLMLLPNTMEGFSEEDLLQYAVSVIIAVVFGLLIFKETKK